MVYQASKEWNPKRSGALKLLRLEAARDAAILREEGVESAPRKEIPYDERDRRATLIERRRLERRVRRYSSGELSGAERRGYERRVMDERRHPVTDRRRFVRAANILKSSDDLEGLMIMTEWYLDNPDDRLAGVHMGHLHSYLSEQLKCA